jgi:hypothetical protein
MPSMHNSPVPLARHSAASFIAEQIEEQILDRHDAVARCCAGAVVEIRSRFATGEYSEVVEQVVDV